MCNEKKQGKNTLQWGLFLAEAKRMLAESKDKIQRHELRRAIRGFEVLIRQKAPMPGQWNRKRAA
jgi:hypothetical protein